MTFEEVTLSTIYQRRGSVHDRRLVVGKYRIAARNVEVRLGCDELAVSTHVPEIHVARVFYFDVSARGERLHAEPVECSLGEFVTWLEGD